MGIDLSFYHRQAEVARKQSALEDRLMWELEHLGGLKNSVVQTDKNHKFSERLRDIAGITSAQQAEINRIRDPRNNLNQRAKLYTPEEVEALKNRTQTKKGNQNIEQELQGEVDMWLGDLTRGV